MAEGKPYDALLLVSFGGPEAPDEVMPFLECVTSGKNIPRARLEQVAEKYYQLGGKSPINQHCRELIDALTRAFNHAQIHLPIYWGNRNSHPWLRDTVRQMRDDGVERALAFVTSAFGSYSGCRQYAENIAQARAEVGESSPVIDKISPFCGHPLFVQSWMEQIQSALSSDELKDRTVLFCAHSLPGEMADSAPYVSQLSETASRLCSKLGIQQSQLVYQSRSGSPQQAWLEPDIETALREIATLENKKVLVVPLGFVFDHVEVIWDLDRQARALAQDLGLDWIRVATPGTSSTFVAMIRDLVAMRMDARSPNVGANLSLSCHARCCLPR